MVLWIALVCVACCSCQPNSCLFEPDICFSTPPSLPEKLPSPFEELTKEELYQDWGKELLIGKSFAREMDLYRALTSFKRALILIPKKNEGRRLEIEYEIFLAYYMGNKYQEAAEAFENSNLLFVPETFPPLNDLLILLYDTYMKIDKPERACKFLGLLTSLDAEASNNLEIETAIVNADFCALSEIINNHPAKDDLYQFLIDYDSNAKSVKKAQTLNALLPGAGYYYVGQKKAALTSFIINALFIAAAYQLYAQGYVPAALITTSLEFGSYVGGINGAGLAAKEYNERIYEALGRNTLIQNRLFPILMIQKGF